MAQSMLVQRAPSLEMWLAYVSCRCGAPEPSTPGSKGPPRSAPKWIQDPRDPPSRGSLAGTADPSPKGPPFQGVLGHRDESNAQHLGLGGNRRTRGGVLQSDSRIRAFRSSKPVLYSPVTSHVRPLTSVSAPSGAKAVHGSTQKGRWSSAISCSRIPASKHSET